MKKHILIFIPAIESGGVERNAILIANGLLAQGYQVSVLYCRAMESQLERFKEGVELVCFPGKQIPHIHPRLTDAYFMKKNLAEYLDGQDVKKTVLIAFQSASVAIGICKKKGVKVICRLSNHPSMVKYEKSFIRKLSEWIRPYTYKKADVIIANSKQLADDFGGQIGKKVVTIYNPIDIENVKALMQEEIEEALKLEAEQYQGKLLIAVGRLSAQKDYGTLIRGFAGSVHKDTMLWILGEGSQRSNIEALIKELGVESRVRLIGYRRNVYKYLKYGTIYILSSLYEGCPNSLMEAVAAGVPCIAADCLSGPREVLLDGAGGLLFPVGDAKVLAECIDAYLNDAKMMAEKAKKAADEAGRFSIENILKMYDELIK